MRHFLILLLLLVPLSCRGQSPARLEKATLIDERYLQVQLSSEEVLEIPPLESLVVRVDGQIHLPTQVSWIREVAAADPAKNWTKTRLRGTLIFRQPLPLGASVEVTYHRQKLTTQLSDRRISPLFHVNRFGYDQKGLKQARVGLYIGTLGEYPIKDKSDFQIYDERLQKVVLNGQLIPSKESGYPYQPQPNQHVLLTDFSGLPSGRYRMQISGLGRSETFEVRENAAQKSARLYALGLYNQRCGQNLSTAYTDHPRPACHTGVVDPLARPVVGGHHDAGDYGRYLYNAAQCAHLYLFSLDHLQAAGGDNLGLPESGDQVPDLLQMALLDLEVVSALQSENGTFYSRLRPRDRAYDFDKSAQDADPQKASPGNSVSSLAAVAVLAQAARSPWLIRNHPERAEHFKNQALKGWESAQGLDFSKTDHHYGEVFGDHDEKLWALVELYLLTGRQDLHRDLSAHLESQRGKLRRWGWLPAHEGYGAAARSYLLSATPWPKDAQCSQILRDELLAAANLWVGAVQASAYGVAFPLQSKQYQTAGWFFPQDSSFDLLVAHSLSSRREFQQAAWSNWNYELGQNPKDRVFVTGAGTTSPQHIVHQQADHDNLEQPPGGIPLGSIVEGPRGKPQLARIESPELIKGPLGKPLDQRWGDYPNVLSEATVVNQARALLTTLWLSQLPPSFSLEGEFAPPELRRRPY